MRRWRRAHRDVDRSAAIAASEIAPRSRSHARPSRSPIPAPGLAPATTPPRLRRSARGYEAPPVPTVARRLTPSRKSGACRSLRRLGRFRLTIGQDRLACRKGLVEATARGVDWRGLQALVARLGPLCDRANGGDELVQARL